MTAQPPAAPPPKKSGVMKGVGIGCFIAFVLVVGGILLAVELFSRMAGEPYTPPDPSPNVEVRRQPSVEVERQADLFLGRSLAVSEQAWGRIFRAQNGTYRAARLVIFRAPTIQTGCGVMRVEGGPAYCSRDGTIYIETGFFGQLARMGGDGDFPLGFVLAHEVGHHVQNQTGQLARSMQAIQSAPTPQQAQAAMIGVELQADCYAGLWGAEMNRGGHLDSGDVEEGIRAATVAGDDTIQMMAQGYVDPRAFTHGSAAQRVAWFRRGLESDDVQACQPALLGGMPP